MATKRQESSESELALLKKELSTREREHRRSLKVQAALYKIADAASASRDMQEFYKQVHRAVGELMFAENFFIAFHDKTTDILSFPYYEDLSKDNPPLPHPLDQSGGGTRIILKAMQPVHITRSEIDMMIAEGEMELREPLAEELMGVPFIVDKNLDGVIVIQNYRKEISYTDADLDVLVFVAQHIATALKRVRALEAERLRTEELAIINSVQEGLAKQLDFQGIIDLIGEKVHDIFKADTTAVGMVDPERDWMSNVYYMDRGERFQIPDGPLQRPSLVAVKCGHSKTFVVRYSRRGDKSRRNSST